MVCPFTKAFYELSGYSTGSNARQPEIVLVCAQVSTGG